MAAPKPSVVVVGAGAGGLASAIELAAGGCRVLVVDRAAASGGKARSVQVGGLEVDAGPTVLTMVWVLEQLFESAGTSLAAEVPLERSTILARHTWSDGTRLDLFADRLRTADAISDVFGAAEGRAYRTFCDETRRIYEIAEGPFLRAQRPTLVGVLGEYGVAGVAAFARLDGHRTMRQALEQRFKSPKLRQLFGRYATYCGSSPFEAPATLNLISHVEAEGVYRPHGGMRALMIALERVARRLGVEFLHGCHVEKILVDRGRAHGVLLPDGERKADVVVFNGDVSALGEGLLGRECASAAAPTKRYSRSLSAVTWAMAATARGFPLVRHNVFFSDDYASEFEMMLKRGRMPAEPTVYVCAQDRADDDADRSVERLLVIVNAAANGDEHSRWTEEERDRCTTVTMAMLQRLGLTLEVTAALQTTPVEFEQLFPATGGALYGPRASGALSALSRHASETSIAGLYLAGGSVHPGPGVPMAVLSGRLAVAKIRKDFGLTA